MNVSSLKNILVKKIIGVVLVVFGVVTLSFCLQLFTGTDPAEMIVRKQNVFATEEQIQAVREDLGLDAPFHERYISYISDVIKGDLGIAITNRKPVIDNIKETIPVRNSIYTNPGLIIYPGICLIVCCAGFNLLGEGLRDIIGKEDKIRVS